MPVSAVASSARLLPLDPSPDPGAAVVGVTPGAAVVAVVVDEPGAAVVAVAPGAAVVVVVVAPPATTVVVVAPGATVVELAVVVLVGAWAPSVRASSPRSPGSSTATAALPASRSTAAASRGLVSREGDGGIRGVERPTGIEPAPPVWKTGALPLSYGRSGVEPSGSTTYAPSSAHTTLPPGAGSIPQALARAETISRPRPPTLVVDGGWGSGDPSPKSVTSMRSVSLL